MRIEVRFRHMEASSSLREYVARRADFALDRFAQEISSLSVWIEDVNGPRGGVDKRCHASITGPRIGIISLDERATDAYAAIDLAMHRLSRATSRAVERAQERERLAS